MSISLRLSSKPMVDGVNRRIHIDSEGIIPPPALVDPTSHHHQITRRPEPLPTVGNRGASSHSYTNTPMHRWTARRPVVVLVLLLIRPFSPNGQFGQHVFLKVSCEPPELPRRPLGAGAALFSATQPPSPKHTSAPSPPARNDASRCLSRSPQSLNPSEVDLAW